MIIKNNFLDLHYKIITIGLIILFAFGNMLLINNILFFGGKMTINNELLPIIQLILLSIGILMAYGVLVYSIFTLVQAFKEMRFKKYLRQTIIYSQPSLDKIRSIAQQYQQQGIKINILNTLKQLSNTTIANKDQELSTHSGLFDDYIEQYNKEAVFDGLPEDARKHLLTISKDDKYHCPIMIIAKDIQNLSNASYKKMQRQRQYTIVSFIITLASFAFTIYMGFNT